MTWKKFWKRVNALLLDNRTVLREGEDIENWEECQRKQREIEAERQRKEQEILATWFLREEYLNAGWFKRLLLRIEFVFRDTRGESHIYYPLFQFIHFDASRHSKLKASKVSREEAKVI